mgnify:FL=1
MLRIVTDSSAEISQKHAAELGIEVLPLTIIFGTEQFRDGIDMMPEEFYKRLVSSSEFPHTAQLGYEELTSLYKDAKEKGDEVLIMPISSALSGTYEWTVRAARDVGYEKVHVYDGKCTTFMLEMLVKEAVKLRERPVEEVISALDDLRSRMRLYAALDTLEYLKRGGRISKAAAMVGGMLKIKPVITVTEDGKIRLIHKSIGMNAALRYISELYSSDKKDANYAVRTIYCMDDSNCLKLRGLVGETPLPPENICPIIGTHIGPSAAGIVYVVEKV